MHNLNQLKLFLCVKWYAIANCKPEKEVINKKRISFPSKKKKNILKKNTHFISINANQFNFFRQ